MRLGEAIGLETDDVDLWPARRGSGAAVTAAGVATLIRWLRSGVNVDDADGGEQPE